MREYACYNSRHTAGQEQRLSTVAFKRTTFYWLLFGKESHAKKVKRCKHKDCVVYAADESSLYVRCRDCGLRRREDR